MHRACRAERPEIETQSALPAGTLGPAGGEGKLRKRHSPSEDGGLVACHHQPFADDWELLEHPLPMAVKVDLQYLPAGAIAKIHQLHAWGEGAAQLRQRVKKLESTRPVEGTAEFAFPVSATGFFRG